MACEVLAARVVLTRIAGVVGLQVRAVWRHLGGAALARQPGVWVRGQADVCVLTSMLRSVLTHIIGHYTVSEAHVLAPWHAQELTSGKVLFSGFMRHQQGFKNPSH